MSPARTSGTFGNFQFDRVFPGVGRIKRSSGTKKLKEFQKRDQLLTKLYESSTLDVLRAFKKGAITIEEIVLADRSNDVTLSMARLSVTAPFWPSVDAALPRMGKSPSTQERYARSLAKLRDSISWSPVARVSDLVDLDWESLEESWRAGAADWNHMRRAVSSFLTVHLRDKYHPLRREIVQRIPIRKEVPRAPDQSVELFLELLELMPVPARPCFMAVALTGMRIGEYVRADQSSLRPHSRAVEVTGKSGVGMVYLTQEGYAIVSMAIPCPLGPPIPAGVDVGRSLRYGRMRRIFRQAQLDRGVSGLTLHDIRHLFGQTAADEGVPTVQTQAQLRHSNADMTRRYELPAQARQAAAAVASRLGLLRPASKRRK